jgi:hypothetical protein
MSKGGAEDLQILPMFADPACRPVCCCPRVTAHPAGPSRMHLMHFSAVYRGGKGAPQG